MGRDGAQSMTILQADRLLGPYEVVVERMQPLSMSSGDFDLAVGADGRAYIYFERVHSALVCADLTPDYLGVTGTYSTHFVGTHPPFTREAPAHFERDGKHYLVTSGTTGYLPNPSQVAVADDWHGPFRVLGDPHGDPSRTSFHSQVSSVFKVPGREDCYVALADRWRPDCMEVPYEAYARLFDRAFTEGMTPGLKLEYAKLAARYPRLGVDNTSIADYVWLPLSFGDDGSVTIPWRDEWTLPS